MPGTRKMEKFELDALTKAHEEERVEELGGDLETRAASASADRQPNAPREGLEMSTVDLPARSFELRASGRAELPARPFDPRAEREQAPGAELPVRPFAPRSGRENFGEVELPARPFPRAESDETGDRPTRPFDSLAEAENARAGSAELPSRAFEPRALDEAMLPAAHHAVHQAPTPVVGWVPNEWIPPQEPEPPSPPRDGASGGVPDVAALRTRLTRKFVTLAESVTDSFRDVAIGAAAYAVELTAPEGMSTGGGKQALQHIRLRPRREGFAVLVAGTVNPVERRADLRDYDHVAALHRVRFKGALDFSREEWDEFLRKAEGVLDAAGIQTMRTPPPRELLDEQRRSTQRVSTRAIGVLVVVLLLAAIVIWRVAFALMNG